MPTDLSVAIARRERERALTEINLFDKNVAAVGTIWLVFYCLSIAHAFTNQAFADAIKLAAFY